MSSTLKRIFRAGINDFRRNSWLSVATVLMMALVLFVIEGLFLFSVVTGALVDSLKDKIDISVYFKKDTPEQDMLSIKQRIEQLKEVKVVEYISENEALARFKTRYADNPLLLESIESLDGNPLQASFNIKAKEPGEFSAITAYLEQAELRKQIDKITYYQNRKVIERFSRIVRTIETSGFLLSLVLAAIAVLIAFNTIRLAIYTSREEIGIMKLVGGTPGFVRGPYLLEGAMYGLIASIASVILFYPVTLLAGPRLANLVPEINLAQYYLRNILQIGGLLVIIGIGLGVLSSFIAIRKYLRV